VKSVWQTWLAAQSAEVAHSTHAWVAAWQTGVPAGQSLLWVQVAAQLPATQVMGIPAPAVAVQSEASRQSTQEWVVRSHFCPPQVAELEHSTQVPETVSQTSLFLQTAVAPQGVPAPPLEPPPPWPSPPPGASASPLGEGAAASLPSGPLDGAPASPDLPPVPPERPPLPLPLLPPLPPWVTLVTPASPAGAGEPELQARPKVPLENISIIAAPNFHLWYVVAMSSLRIRGSLQSRVDATSAASLSGT
jgi:hypothetical protein